MQAYSYGSINVWDNGYPSGGNYWSDYDGVDEKHGPNQDLPGSDGIGDTPYVIDNSNVDHYPLMRPWLTLADFPRPFLTEDGVVDFAFVLGASWPHGRHNYGASVADIIGSNLIALRIAPVFQAGDFFVSYHDTDVIGYNPQTGEMWRGDTAYSHLISVGGPGVNMVFDYYNDLLPARFDPSGGWHIVTPRGEYWKTVDRSGRTIEDYAIIALHYDGAKDSYVLLIGGIGAEGSVAASISIADKNGIEGKRGGDKSIRRRRRRSSHVLEPNTQNRKHRNSGNNRITTTFLLFFKYF